MKWDLKKMESKLFNLSNESKKQDKKMKETIKRIADKDDTKQSYDFLSDEEREYRIMNDAYKKYISQYSQAYIEMSEYYYGPELPYDIYCKEFKKNPPGKDWDGIYTFKQK